MKIGDNLFKQLFTTTTVTSQQSESLRIKAGTWRNSTVPFMVLYPSLPAWRKNVHALILLLFTSVIFRSRDHNTDVVKIILIKK